MTDLNQRVKQDAEAVINAWMASEHLREGDLFVVGCSTSEVSGKHIGTSGSEDIAAILFEALIKLKQAKHIDLAFQCCEHLNRAIVIERATLTKYRLEEVSVIPVPTAGGSMASYAYKHMEDPVVVESIQANKGIDIGETMIGMHLKPVAVPLRFDQRFIGEARVTAARTRPKLIGGSRANYE